MAAQDNGHVEAHELELPLLQVPLQGIEIKIGRVPGSPDDRVVVLGPVLVQFVVPLDSEIARGIARDLTGGIVLP